MLELFHGPTFAFKDVGARVMARLMAALNAGDRPLTILVATSGDTGSAVAQAFSGLPARASWCCFPSARSRRCRRRSSPPSAATCRRLAVERDLRRLPAAREGGLCRPRHPRAGAADLGQLDQHRPAAAADFLLRPRGPRARSRGRRVLGAERQLRQSHRRTSWPGGSARRSARFVAATTVNDTFPRYLATGRYEPRAVGGDARQCDGRRRPEQRRAPALAVRR